MDIEIKCYNDPYGEKDTQTMKINGTQALTVSNLCECPEDATVSRELVNCVQVSRFMKAAYDSGCNKEGLNIKITQVDNREDCWE